MVKKAIQCLCALILLVSFNAVAYANDTKINVPFQLGDTIIINYGEGFIMSAPAPHMEDNPKYDRSKDIAAFIQMLKEQDPKAAALFIDEPGESEDRDIVAQRSFILSDYKYRNIHPSVGRGTIFAQFTGNGTRQITRVYINGTAESWWGGEDGNYAIPENKQLGVTWTVKGVSVSVQVPGGIGFSGSGTTLNWNGSCNLSRKFINLDYGNIQWNGSGWTTAEKRVHGTHNLGGTHYLVEAYDKRWL